MSMEQPRPETIDLLYQIAGKELDVQLADSTALDNRLQNFAWFASVVLAILLAFLAFGSPGPAPLVIVLGVMNAGFFLSVVLISLKGYIVRSRMRYYPNMHDLYPTVLDWDKPIVQRLILEILIGQIDKNRQVLQEKATDARLALRLVLGTVLVATVTFVASMILIVT